MKTGWALLALTALLGCAHSGGKTPRSLRFLQPEISGEARLQFDDLAGQKILKLRRSESVKMAASGAFTEAGARQATRVAPVVLMVDLRQEAHGWVNGKPVTWKSLEGPATFTNVGMTPDEVLRREKRLLSEIHIGQKIGKEKVRSVETEESLVRSKGQNYLRLAVTEHLRPSDAQVDRFLEAVQDMPPESWIFFHDRDGRGRSVLFSLMYDMLRNAWNTSYEVILQRNLALSGQSEFMSAPTEAWLQDFHQDRVDFIQEFYQYAKAHPLGKGRWWSQWSR